MCHNPDVQLTCTYLTAPSQGRRRKGRSSPRGEEQEDRGQTLERVLQEPPHQGPAKNPIPKDWEEEFCKACRQNLTCQSPKTPRSSKSFKVSGRGPASCTWLLLGRVEPPNLAQSGGPRLNLAPCKSCRSAYIDFNSGPNAQAKISFPTNLVLLCGMQFQKRVFLLATHAQTGGGPSFQAFCKRSPGKG